MDLHKEHTCVTKVMEQALEALEGKFGVPDQWTGARAGGVAVWNPGPVYAAITALRTAINSAKEQKPVAWRYWHSNGDGTESEDVHFGSTFPPYKTPVRPPVPLYTTPSAPRSQPLTDEQIDEIFLKVVEDYEAGRIEYESHGLARAIEAAHGIRPAKYSQPTFNPGSEP